MVKHWVLVHFISSVADGKRTQGALCRQRGKRPAQPRCSRRRPGGRRQRRDAERSRFRTGGGAHKIVGAVANARPTETLTGRTAWGRSMQTPLRECLRTETGGAVVLLAATAAALLWVNVDASSYERFWTTTLAIDVGGSGV